MAYNNLSRSEKFYELQPKRNAIILFAIYKSCINYFDIRCKDSVFSYSNKIKLLLKTIKIPQYQAWYYATSGRDLVTYSLNSNSIISAKQYEIGKNNILKSLSILDKYKIKKNKIRPYAYGILADLYLREKKYDSAISNYKKSKAGYLLIKSRNAAIDITPYIAKAYQKQGNLAQALFYFENYYNESLKYQQEKNDRGLRENELQIHLLAQEKEIQDKKNQQIISRVIIIIALLLLILLLRNFKLKLDSNRKLAVVNDNLEHKNILLDKKNSENELLLKEIHHRVKNNLEVVSSLLALQLSQIKDPRTKEAMIEGRNRVNSIGIVHQKLYQGSNFGVVNMKDYFLNLGESILDSFGAEHRIDFVLDMQNVVLDIDTAVPLGLIVNELLTNSIKYAFPEVQKGTITIKLQKQNQNILHLEVADNGIGKSGIILGTGFGSQLVSLLTNQLNGTMIEENHIGTKFVFDFRLKIS